MVSFLSFVAGACVVFKAAGSFVRFIKECMLLESAMKKRSK